MAQALSKISGFSEILLFKSPAPSQKHSLLPCENLEKYLDKLIGKRLGPTACFSSKTIKRMDVWIVNTKVFTGCFVHSWVYRTLQVQETFIDGCSFESFNTKFTHPNKIASFSLPLFLTW